MEQQKANINITLDKTLPVICDECGSDIFHEVLYIRKASKFLIGSAQDALIPIPVFACAKCNHVNQDLMSPDMRNQPEN